MAILIIRSPLGVASFFQRWTSRPFLSVVMLDLEKNISRGAAKSQRKNNLTPRPGDPKKENIKNLLGVLCGFAREK
jgi:hypothetical protein